MLATVAFSLACGTSACNRSSAWANLQVDATFSVDGKPQHASTVWRTRIADTFPSGATETTHGDALVLKIAPGQYVFGTLAEYSNRQALQGSIATAIDSFVLEARKRHNIYATYGTKAAERDAAVAEATGLQVPICGNNPAQRVQPPCLLFVTFQDLHDPRTMKQVQVGKHFDIAGRDLIINSVTIEFTKSQPHSSLPDLKWLHDSPDHLVAKIPAGSEMPLGFSVYVQDFRR